MKLKQLCLAAALCALGSAASAQEVIKLGYAGPMTGPQAQYGNTDAQNRAGRELNAGSASFVFADKMQGQSKQ